MNAKVGDAGIEIVVDAWVVLGVNGNKYVLVDECVGKRLGIMNT